MKDNTKKTKIKNALFHKPLLLSVLVNKIDRILSPLETVS